jgi:hypothetical protein
MVGLMDERDEGGPVRRPARYIVGEERPELFVPLVSGWVIPERPLEDDEDD